MSSLSSETWYVLLLISFTFIILTVAFVINLVSSNRRLKKEKDFSSSIVDTNPALIITLDSEKRVVHFNKSCELISGYNSDEITGRFFKDIPIVREEIFSTDGTNLGDIQDKFPTYFESQWISKTGKKCIIAWSTIEFQNPVGGVNWILSGIDITEQKKAEEALNKSHQQLQNLSAHLQTVREEERTRIAREIHDELGQLLSTLLLDISWLENQISNDNKDKELEKLKSMSMIIENAIGQVQQITSELRPSLLDDLGLLPAIERQVKEFSKKTGIHCKVIIDNKNIKINREISTTIFRIIQESLTNVMRHANASKVTISLRLVESNLLLEIRDNGIGISEEKINAQNSLGLLGIRERVRSIKGELEIMGNPQKGTVVKVSIKLN